MTKDNEFVKLRAEGVAQLKRIGRLSKDRGLAAMKKMDPTVFEHLTAALFRREGYTADAVGMSGDEGVDVVATKGFKKVVVQCKRYEDSVGQPTVRDLYGTMMHNNASEAYLVTTGTLTRQAEAWAEGKPIQLIDGFELVNWIAESQQKENSQWRRWLIAAAVAVLLLGGLGWYFGPTLFTSLAESEMETQQPHRYFLPIVINEGDYY